MLFVLGMFSFVLLTGISLPACGSPAVEIPDHNLNIMIRNAIGKLEGDIYPWDLEELTVLEAGRYNLYSTEHIKGMIYDLTGLEYCTSLEVLDLNTNPITDITPLASLTKLNALILSNTGITDITSLASLTLLETLDLSNNQITDISSLASLTNLKTLYLQDNMIKDISSLASITSLQELYLFNNRINDISSLSSTDSLKILSLGPIWSVTQSIFTPQMPGGSNQVSDLSPLRNLVTLEYLNLNANEVSDLHPISNLVNLKKLFLYSNLITDISPLASLVNLVELNLSSNEIDDISPLLDLTSLKKLAIYRGVREESSAEAQVVGKELMDRGVSFIVDEDSSP